MTDPFDILGLPPTFDLAPAALRAAYLARAAAVHPDIADDPVADDAAARLNHARRTLENPETRAEALLRRLGGPSKDEDRSLPPAFLQEMMETREQIEADLASGDPAAPVKWDQWAQDRRRAAIGRVRSLFASLTIPADSAARRAIRMELNMWRYVERLIEQLMDASRGAH